MSDRTVCPASAVAAAKQLFLDIDAELIGRCEAVRFHLLISLRGHLLGTTRVFLTHRTTALVPVFAPDRLSPQMRLGHWLQLRTKVYRKWRVATESCIVVCSLVVANRAVIPLTVSPSYRSVKQIPARHFSMFVQRSEMHSQFDPSANSKPHVSMPFVC